MQVVIFGADKLGVDFYFEVKHRESVIAFADNNAEKWGKEILGIEVLSPEMLQQLEFDKVYIASLQHWDSIRCQILGMGIDENKIAYVPVVLDKIRENAKKPIDALYQYQNIYGRDEYEKEWKRIKEKYDDIRVYELSADAIGELIPRFFLAEKVCKKNGLLNIFIPGTETGSGGRICNKFLLELIARKIHLIKDEEIALWTYILNTHPDEIDVSAFEMFHIRNNYPTYQIEKDDVGRWFTEEEEKQGEHFLNQIHVTKPFVCVAARSGAYNQRTIGHDFSYDYRNMKFEKYEEAISYLKNQKMISVRMGRMEDPLDLGEQCVDYAGLYADDFRDLFLASRCEFMISTSSGIVFMATLFAKPVLVVNSLFVSFGYGGSPYTAYDLYIPKRYYDVKKGRYLTLREIIKVEAKCLIWEERYHSLGIKFMNNTPEEIVLATREMVERLAGRWQDTEEDQRNYIRYLELYDEMKRSAANNPDNWIGGPVPYRIATTYLRNNLYLLD